jgi:hypothetical protein
MQRHAFPKKWKIAIGFDIFKPFRITSAVGWNYTRIDPG